MGLTPVSAGYETFEVKPNLGGLDWFEGTVPVKDGIVSVKIKDGAVEVTASKDGGTLIWGGEKYLLEEGITKRIAVN